MGRRPKDHPFGALAALRGQLTPGRQPAPRPRRKPSAAPDEARQDDADPDDLVLFLSALDGVKPLPADGRAIIERPRPAPLPRPRVEEESAAENPLPAPAPDDDAAFFRHEMSDVVRLADDGRADFDRRPANAALSIATSLLPSDMPWLPDDIDDPAALFRYAVGGAAPLPERNRAELEKALPAPHPRKREEDEAAVLHESINAPLSFEDRIDTGDESVYLRDGVPRRALTDLRRGRWVVQAELDLHGLTRDEARAALGVFLRAALERGDRCVRLIHGKGLGSPGREPVLKHLSRGWLMQREEILAFCQARPHDGGEGALLVLLRAPRIAERQ
ncbi:MAG: Smr/MutS family protein [Azospira sp.]|jgi:DNA-nicking Smr family endonuclease|nr:Smr/MutS family protein [Azospira sp.]